MAWTFLALSGELTFNQISSRYIGMKLPSFGLVFIPCAAYHKARGEKRRKDGPYITDSRRKGHDMDGLRLLAARAVFRGRGGKEEGGRAPRPGEPGQRTGAQARSTSYSDASQRVAQ